MKDQFDLDHQDEYNQELPEILEPEVAGIQEEEPDDEVREEAAYPRPWNWTPCSAISGRPTAILSSPRKKKRR